MGKPPGLKYGGTDGSMVLQTTTPLALLTRASATFMKRLIFPLLVSTGVPPVAGLSSMEPRFRAAVASFCDLVQVIGLMATAPGCTTGLLPSTLRASVFQEAMPPVFFFCCANGSDSW